MFEMQFNKIGGADLKEGVNKSTDSEQSEEDKSFESSALKNSKYKSGLVERQQSPSIGA